MSYSSLFDIWKQSAEKFKDKAAFSNDDGSVVISYERAFRLICYFAKIFSNLHINKFDKVALFAENNPYWLILEQAVITAGGICVSKNSINGLDELDYVFHNSNAVAVISDKIDIINYFIDSDKDFGTGIKFALYFGDEELNDVNPSVLLFENLMKTFNPEDKYLFDCKNKPDDVCYIHYTSGTSALPKGAILVNEGMYYQVEEIAGFLKDFTPQTFIATFPLASAGGKCFNLFCLSIGCKIVYTPYKNFFDKIADFRPDFLHCAPKIMTTLHLKYREKISEQGKLFSFLFDLSYSFSLLIIKLQRMIYNRKPANTDPEGILKIADNFLSSVREFQDKILYKKVRNFFLKDNIVVAVGSAALARQTEDFYNIIGTDIVQHFGMTETTGLTTHTTIRDQKERPYTLGVTFSRTRFKIISPETGEVLSPGQKGILLLKGPEVMKGYYNNEEATKKALTSDGWLITGDLAVSSEDNYLTILSRYDDVIVMMNGYNVYAPSLQNQALLSPFVKQIAVVGHGKQYLSALVVLCNEKYINWCRANNFQILKPNDNEKFKNYLLTELNKLIQNRQHGHYFEKLKKLHFLDNEFTSENGMLTKTFKIKYKKILEIYHREIESMYRC